MCLVSNAACVASGSEIPGDAGGGSPGGGGPTGEGGYVGAGPAETSTDTAGAGGSTGDYMSPTTVVGSSSSAGGSTSSAVASSSSAGSSTSSGMGCVDGTRVTYGSLWDPAPNHPDSYDDVVGATVGWDGVCTPQGTNSSATLSNGWAPYFETESGCVIGFDPLCPPAVPAPCTTRITYGPTWLPAANHPTNYDDVPGKVTWLDDRACVSFLGKSFAMLSNGWQPNFQGDNACQMSFRYQNCGGV
jgi:hypothetical protein